MLDTIAGLIIGVFLLTVAVKGNTKEMMALAKRDKAFLQWAIAVGILVYLYSIPSLKSTMGLLIAAAFIGLGLMAGDKIFAEGKKFWDSLGA
jgi:chromate transport protein ChrA